jgi:hypothetical protein
MICWRRDASPSGELIKLQNRILKCESGADRLDPYFVSCISAALHVIQPLLSEEDELAKAKKNRGARPYTAADIKLLRQHSRTKTPVVKIVKQMKRTEGSLRQKALRLGIGLGHTR